VGAGENVPFGTLSNTPPATALTLLNANTNTAAMRVADTGYYQVSFGFLSVTAGDVLFQLQVGGVGSAQQTIETNTVNTLIGETVIIQITSNPTDLTLVNQTGIAVNVGGVSASSITAYMTIYKLR